MVTCGTCAGVGDDVGDRSDDSDPAANRNERVKPVDRLPPDLRLSDKPIDLMKDFRLSNAEAIGGAWAIPVRPLTPFDERYGQW